jgi:cytochrome c553
MKKLKKISMSQSSVKNATSRFGKISAGLVVVVGFWFSGSALADPPKLVTEVCAACHGEDGNSAAPIFPKLAGQSKEYLTKQLNNFITGKRKNEMMAPIAAALKPAEIKELVDYFGSQKTSAGTVQDASLSAEGKKIFLEGIEASDVPVCAGCHLPSAEGNGIFPKLAGQHADYIFLQMQNFSSAERNNDVSRFMRVVAKHMNEQQMKAVAEYLSEQ